jgi:hypothetical protein
MKKLNKMLSKRASKALEPRNEEKRKVQWVE